MANASIKQIFQEFPANGIDEDDLIVFYSEITGITKAIKAVDLLGTEGTPTQFEWVSTATYQTGTPIVYAGQWWISLIDNNIGNIPTEGASWTAENKVNAIVIKPWTAGIVEYSNSVVTVDSIIYRLKDTTPLPFNSQTSPNLDLGNWDAIGAGFTVDTSGLNVVTGTTPQEIVDSIDSALTKARGTEVSSGGIVTFGATDFTVGDTEGQIFDGVTYTAINYTAGAPIASADITQLSTYIYFDLNGNIQQQFTEPTTEEFRTKLFLTRLASNGVNFVAQERLKNPSGQYTNLVRDLVGFLGSLKKGFSLVPNADRTFQRGAGMTFELGSGDTYTNPNIPNYPLVNPAPFFQVTRTGIPGATTTIINNNDYNPTGDTLTPLTNGRFRIDTVYFFTSGNITLQIGQAQYGTLEAAEAAIATRDFELNPVNNNGIRLGWIILQKGVTDLTNTTDAKFINDLGAFNTVESVVGALLASNNLSDVPDKPLAVSNIGAASLSVYNLLTGQQSFDSFISFNRSVLRTGGTLVDDFPFIGPLLILNSGSSSDLIINSIAPLITISDNDSKNRILIIRNDSDNSHNIIINNNSSGTAANRFYIGKNLTIPPKNGAVFMYRDEGTGQDGWILVSKSSNLEDYPIDSTGSVINFDRPRTYGTSLVPITATTLTDSDVSAQRTIQKIYHNAASFTPPASWVKLASSGEYAASTLNIIYVEYQTATRKEYVITQDA